jgi:hypothetical protein
MSDVLDDIVEKLEQEAKTLPAKKNQCTQHLIELGYLSLFKANALLEKDIEKAKVEFLQDVIDSGLYSLDALNVIPSDDEDEFIASLLAQAADIDEGFTFSKLPEAGEQTLQSRILHYRLDIFGMWQLPVSNPYDIVNSKAALARLGDFLTCDPLTSLNLMADVEKLTLKLVETHQGEDFIITIKPRQQVEKQLQRKLNRTRKFKNQLIEDFGERTEFFRYLSKEILKDNSDKVDFAFLERELRKPFKQFMMRLIQVHQWQEGSYTGLLDSDIGEVTINSILNSIDLYNQVAKKNIKPSRILTHLANDYYLFNGLFFLQEYMIEENDVTNPEEQILADLTQNISKADDQQLNAFELNMSVLKAEVSLASEAQPRERKGFLQRIYYGVKKFFKKVASISKVIFELVVKLAEKFRGMLKKIFGKLFDDLYTGIKAFIDGLKFFLGRKETVTENEEGMIASVIRLDGDCYNIAIGNSPDQLVDQHNKMIRYQVKSMRFALAVVGGVLKIFMYAITVFSWPLLIMAIVKTMKNIKETYQNLNLVTN